jgi:hypothetical protein
MAEPIVRVDLTIDTPSHDRLHFDIEHLFYFIGEMGGRNVHPKQEANPAAFASAGKTNPLGMSLPGAAGAAGYL